MASAALLVVALQILKHNYYLCYTAQVIVCSVFAVCVQCATSVLCLLSREGGGTEVGPGVTVPAADLDIAPNPQSAGGLPCLSAKYFSASESISSVLQQYFS